jgi:glycosyltransferase involved in cell wall biosynthesis
MIRLTLSSDLRTRVNRYIQSLSLPLRDRVRLSILAICAADLVRIARQERIDHIHVHSFADAAHLAAMAHIMGGPSYSLHLHGDLEVYGAHHAKKAEQAAFVACDAQPLRGQLEKIGIPRAKIHLGGMGVNVDRYRPPPSPSPRVDTLQMVTVARLNAAKGHHVALAALRCAVDMGLNIRYAIVGEGPHRSEVEAEIIRQRLVAQVEMLGSLGEDAVVPLMHRSHVFVLSSVGFGEALPVSVMEAMACGVPAVCSIIGGTPDMIKDGVDGLLVNQGDIRGFAAAFQRLWLDEPLRQRLGMAARARAVASFDYRTAARALKQRIEGCLNANSSRHSRQKVDLADGLG